MNELFGKIKELAKKKGCNIQFRFHKDGNDSLFFDFGGGNHIAMKLPDSFSDEVEIDDFIKNVEYSLDVNLSKLKNNHNLNVISHEIGELIDAYNGSCAMCDTNNCADCNVERFLHELRSLNKKILKLKDGD